MAQVITIEPNTEIDTIQKALDAMTDTDVTVYIKDGTYTHNSLVQMSKTDTFIYWIGEGIDTIIKFLNAMANTDFQSTTNFRHLRFKCDDSMPSYSTGYGHAMAYFRNEDNTFASFENCLFDLSDNGLYPDYYLILNGSQGDYISNKTFTCCTFNAPGKEAVSSHGTANFINCVYNTDVLERYIFIESFSANTYKDEISQITYLPMTYRRCGIYAGDFALPMPTIKQYTYDSLRDNIEQYGLTYTEDDGTGTNTLNTESIPMTLKESIVSAIRSKINSEGGDSV